MSVGAGIAAAAVVAGMVGLIVTGHTGALIVLFLFFACLSAL